MSDTTPQPLVRRAAVLDPDGLVKNVILIADDVDPRPDDTVLLDDDSPVGPGWTIDADGEQWPPADDAATQESTP